MQQVGSLQPSESPQERSLRIALQVSDAADLLSYRSVPDRPRKLPESGHEGDAAIAEAADDYARGGALSDDKKAICNVFGTWRMQVWKQEAKNAYNAALLCSAYRTLDARSLPIDRVVDALGTYTTNGQPIDWGQAPQDFDAAIKWAASRLRDDGALSSALRRAGL